ncbi:MAG: hypothetical protein J6J07_03805 [Oscillospiraceae bacterium]|nr:hypothetical protein [Oscillospiraceae bacterium]
MISGVQAMSKNNVYSGRYARYQSRAEKDIEDIKAKQKALEEKFYEVSAKVYQQANPNGNPNMGAQPGCDGNCGDCGNHGGDDGYVDADYKEV